MWSAVLITLLLAVAVVDGRRQVIPDALNGALFATGLARAASAGLDGLVLSVATAGVVFAAFFLLRAVHSRWRGSVGLGLGDVKFLAAASVWIGLDGLPIAVLVASLSGLAYVLVRSRLAQDVTAATRIAFGPHLALGLAAVWVTGPAA